MYAYLFSMAGSDHHIEMNRVIGSKKGPVEFNVNPMLL